MIFIKLVRVLGIVLAAGLVCHLLYSAARKSLTTGPRRQNGKTRRKYVESSVVEKKDETPEQENSQP